MPQCPGAQLLQGLLDGELPALEISNVSSHIELCSECQQNLETLTDGIQLRHWMSGDGRLGQGDSSVDSPPSAEDVAGRLAGYELQEQVGRGGMGVVYRAVDRELRRPVAIKVLLAMERDAAARRRFLLEARALANLRSDHVVQVFSVHDEPGQPPCFAMEWIEGHSLKQFVEKSGALPPRTAASWIAQAARGLAAAHAAGMVHRDVKPSNLLCDTTSGRVKVGDFGLVRFDADAPDLTRSGMLVGTPGTMSPEQIDRPQQVDARSDVYGLGVCLYFALTGEMPFRGTLHAVLESVRHVDPLPLRRLNPYVPLDLETIALRCLEKSPDKRLDSAHHVADELDRYLAGRPIRSRRLGKAARTWRHIARNPVRSALVALLAIALLGGAAVSSWFAMRASRERGLAETHQLDAERRLEAALKTIDEVCVRISEDHLLQQPGFQPLRRELLGVASRQLRDFVSQSPNDPRLIIPWCQAASRLAEVERQTIGPAAAKATLLPAVAALRAFEPVEAVEAADIRQLFAKLLMNLAIAEENLGEFSQADARWQEVERLCQGSNDPVDRWLLARLYVNWGKSARDQGRVQQSYDLNLRAQQIAKMLVDEGELLPETRHTYAYSTGNLVNPLASLGRMAEAETACRDAMAIWRACADEDPIDLTPPMELSRNAVNLCDILTVQRRWLEVKSLCDEIRPICDRYCAQNPNLNWSRVFRARLVFSDALAQHQLGQIDAAKLDYVDCRQQFALESALDPTNDLINYLLLSATVSLAGCELDADRPVDALAWLDESRRLHPALARPGGIYAVHVGRMEQLNFLGQSICHCESGNVPGALAALDQALAASTSTNQALCKVLQRVIGRQHEGPDLELSREVLVEANRQWDEINKSTNWPGLMLCLMASLKMQLIESGKSPVPDGGSTLAGSAGSRPSTDDLNPDQLHAEAIDLVRRAQRLGYFSLPGRRIRAEEDLLLRPLLLELSIDSR